MTYREIAALIPQNYRQEILETNMIANAVATTTDKNMNMLAIIWRTYIDPNLNTGCNVCMQQLYANWNAILPSIVQIEKESRLLNSTQ